MNSNLAHSSALSKTLALADAHASPAPASRKEPSHRLEFTFGAGTYQLWLRWLDGRSWKKGQRHYSRRAALVRARSLDLSADEITDELLARCDALGDPRREPKVRADIEEFYTSDPRVEQSRTDSAPADHSLDVELRTGVLSMEGLPANLKDLRAVSPGSPPDCEQIIDTLFRPSALLCVGCTEYSFTTKPRELLRGSLRDMQYICPQPMTKEKGLTTAGHLSFHSLENCGPWTYLIIEWDSSTTAEQARMLIHLRDFSARLVLVVHSGGESLHGWFFVGDWPDERREAFAAYALRLGACSGTIKNRSQFVRMPQGLRPMIGKRAARQIVHYFDGTEVLP